MNKQILALVAGVFLYACGNDDTENSTNYQPFKSNVALLSYSVGATFAHDTSSYTQGLEFYKGKLLEGTGNKGKSKLAEVDLKTGKALRQVKLDTALFGEGITVLNDTIYQLTWQEKKVLVYTAKDLKKIKELPLNTDGWGLTNNGKELIATDGSSNLYFYEPGTFRLLRVQSVVADGTPIAGLNEMEYINGFIYANQYQQPYIFKINPESGEIVGRLDLSDVVNRLKVKAPGADVLNGIAYNPDTKKLYITGKWWPELYEINVAL